MQQLESVTEETARFGQELPNQTYELRQRGLVLPIDEMQFKVELGDGSMLREWKATRDLTECSPNEEAFERDVLTRTLRFGNGVNGRMPPAGAPLIVTYQTCAGVRGNLPTDIEWSVQRILGTFGRTSEPTMGGDDGVNLAALRAEARRESVNAHAHVTAEDLMNAAYTFTDLGVRRALEVPPSAQVGRRARGSRVLVVVGPHDSFNAFV